MCIYLLGYAVCFFAMAICRYEPTRTYLQRNEQTIRKHLNKFHAHTQTQCEHHHYI